MNKSISLKQKNQDLRNKVDRLVMNNLNRQEKDNAWEIINALIENELQFERIVNCE